jgi:hypothetical protein
VIFLRVFKNLLLIYRLVISYISFVEESAAISVLGFAVCATRRAQEFVDLDFVNSQQQQQQL